MANQKNKRHLVCTIEDCSKVIRTFKTKIAANKFIKSFSKAHPKSMDGWWVDLVVYGVSGDIINDGELVDE